MPRDAIGLWKRELFDWLHRIGIDAPADQPLPEIDTISQQHRSEYQKQRNRLWNWNLDRCHGECVLRRHELAKIVLDSLQHFDGERYDLDSAIIMPNHVHLIAQFRLPTTCRKQCESWMHYSAHEINRSLRRSGPFWQGEPFDHLIRSAEQFEYLQRYIAENGRKEKLPVTNYLYWKRG